MPTEEELLRIAQRRLQVARLAAIKTGEEIRREREEAAKSKREGR